MMIKLGNEDNRFRSQNNPLLNSSHNEQTIPETSVVMSLREQNNRSHCCRNPVIYIKKPLSQTAKRRLKYFGIFLIIFAVLCFLLAFVVFPLVFMNSIELQRLIMFTNVGLPSDSSHFQKYEIKAGLRNLYVKVNDVKSKDVILLGVWHLLPHLLTEIAITNENFNYDNALRNSNLSVLLYFHGTGEDRSSSLSKYTIFRYFFHVITFDYRNYGDSSRGELSENAVVNDCVQLYEWLTTKTTAPIIVWGHSLGSALAIHSLAILRLNKHITQPMGVVLEAAFTKMSEELYKHPYGKIFAWLPWFESTVIQPLEKNGFVFDTSTNILKIQCPVMILCSEDDSIVPYKFGEKLQKISTTREIVNTTLYYQFEKKLRYDHYFAYRDPFLPFFINYFHYICFERINGTTH